MKKHSLGKHRYSRHSEFISAYEQSKIGNIRLLLAGCGAGSTLAINLARIGYATRNKGLIILADPDTVDISNLNRQAFAQEDIGANKAKALGNIIKRINPEVHTLVIQEGITLDNLYNIISNCDMVIDMIDVLRPEIMIALHRQAKKLRKPVITGFDLGEGTISFVFDYRKAKNMSLDQYLGFEGISLDAIGKLNSLGRLGIVAQFLIGTIQNSNGKYLKFNNSQDMLNYYNNLFISNIFIKKLKASVPLEMHHIIDKIRSGKLKFIPQINSGAEFLGIVHEQLLRRLIVKKVVPTVPQKIIFDLNSFIDSQNN